MRRGPGLRQFCRRRERAGDRAPPTFVPSSTPSFTSCGQAASDDCCYANFHRVARSIITFKPGKTPVPFCCGLPGSIKSTMMPIFVVQAVILLSPKAPLEPKGPPLSQRIAFGRASDPIILHNCSKLPFWLSAASQNFLRCCSSLLVLQGMRPSSVDNLLSFHVNDLLSLPISDLLSSYIPRVWRCMFRRFFLLLLRTRSCRIGAEALSH